MKVLASMSLILLLVASSSQAPSPEVPGRDPKKLQVLILTGYNMHDWRTITEALRSTLEATGRFEVRVNEEPVGCDERTFDGYDAIVLNFTNHAGVFGPAVAGGDAACPAGGARPGQGRRRVPRRPERARRLARVRGHDRRGLAQGGEARALPHASGSI